MIFRAIPMLFAGLSLLRCGPDNDQRATVHLHLRHVDVDSVILYDYSTLRERVLARAAVDAAGRSVITVELDGPLFAGIRSGEVFFGGAVYLEPGYRTSVAADSGSVEFTGDGAAVSTYLRERGRRWQDIRFAGGRPMAMLSEDRFLERLDSIEAELRKTCMMFLDTTDLPAHLMGMLGNADKVTTDYLIQEYALMQRYRASAKKEPLVLPEALQIRAREIILDTALLNAGFGDYEPLLELYLQNDINHDLLVRGFEERRGKDAFATEAARVIKERGYPPAFEESLLARNVLFWMRYVALTPSTDSLYRAFRTDFPASRYQAALQETREGYMAIAAGKPAPDIVGQTESGDSVWLHELKGNVVYVDVWATWCGPCVAEIPSSVRLQDRFRNRDDIVFLNVSVDRDTAAWKRKLAATREWTGMHIVNNDRSIHKSYRITGIPRYILIDKSGHIIDSDAPRPSSDQIAGVLEEALEGNVAAFVSE